MPSNNLHVLHLSTNATWRGGEQQVAYLLDELKAKGVTQTIVGRKNSAMQKYCEENGYSYVGFKRKSSVSLRFAFKLNRLYRKNKIDIIHAHDSHGHTFAVLADTLFGGSPPIVVSRRVSFPVSKSIFSKFKYNYLKVKSIICSSQAVMKITEPSIRDKSVLSVVYDGIDIDKFKDAKDKGVLRKEFNIPSDTPIVGNIAALTSEKDYFTFIDTAAICIQQELKAAFVIIGGGRLEAELKQYAKAKGVAELIHFAGYRTDAHQLLPEFNVFLATPTNEGLGTSILDAMACNIPVVATNAGGILESVIHMKTGWLSPVKDAENLAEGIKNILTENQLSVKLTDEAKKRLNNFSKQSMGEGVYNQYNQL